jgi:transcription initiation factor IIE alpha subunit
MSVEGKVVQYLSKRKTAASSKEISLRTGANWKTVRNVLGILANKGVVVNTLTAKCSVDKTTRTGYALV